jgi:putative transposase
VRYVERNALRAGLVERAEQWPWGSLPRQTGQSGAFKLSDWPLPRPSRWTQHVNQPQSEAELEAIRRCLRRGQPYGSEAWTERTAHRLGLQSTLRPRGRPRLDQTKKVP